MINFMVPQNPGWIKIFVSLGPTLIGLCLPHRQCQRRFWRMEALTLLLAGARASWNTQYKSPRG